MTMNAVAARAKAGKGTFYCRWQSKANWSSTPSVT
ncbi:TetR family transcriptional regulator [Kribbella sp. NPDC056861]